MSETFDGLNALMDTSPEPPPNPQGGKTTSGSSFSGEGFTVEMPSGSEYGVMPAGSASGFISGQNGMPFPMSVSTLPDPANPAPRDNTVRTDDVFSALPTLGLPDTSPEDDAAKNEARWAGNASQAGQILSSEDAVDASLGYVRGIGENLLNQQVNDWLNQVGHARIQFGSNKTGDADVLVPLIDNPNSLFFSQIGLRANEERTTTNLGLGYRQYEDGWMWGVNSFYDYDITGSNSRVGVGGELWADYLKFAANGYFRVTDWHQSKLHEMRDYDERPANGFDIRAEGYLPDYPQLGAFAKYEQYFGDGVSLASTTSSGELKSNPSVSTIGLSYTPFPLITFKGQTSRGDSNDSQVGMELSYRFGVPLSQQLDTDNVDLMRNLAGNRYDFVDRNYNIVMQYRKQELLRIALPPTLRAEAAQTVPVTVSVLKAKYGLKSLRWSAPELLANGGEIKQTGLTTADITLPAYIFANRSGEPQGYRVTAVGEDNEGNPSNTAEMWVNVIPSVETITKLTVTPNQSLVANNRDQFTAVALLQNDKGEVLPNKAVTFSVSGLKNPEGVTIYDADGNNGQTLTVISGPDGTATVKIISKSAGKASLQAKMRNGNSRSESIIYIADLSTAKIKTLELTNNKAVADGQAKNIAVATVTDQFDNQVENFPLTARADNGATVVDPNQQTDDNGQVTIRFSSETAGDSKLVVEGTGTSKSVTAQFVADMSTAQIQSVTTENDGAVANGQAKNSVLVTVTDNRNNPLAGAPVTISVPGTARYQTQPASGMTDNQGRLRVYITNTKAGSEDYTFSINNSSVTKQLLFKPDESTATITDSQLKIVADGQKADGTSVNRVQATVLDAYGNRIPGYTVQFITDNNAQPSQAQLTTDGNGETIFDLTNTKSGKTKVTAQVNGKTASVNVTFTADSATAKIADMTVTADGMPANGEAKNAVEVTVTDASGNIVPFVAVLFTADNSAQPPSQSLMTDENGKILFSMTNTVATQVNVTAKVNTSEMSAVVMFKADTTNPDAGKSSLSANPMVIVADGSTESALTLILKDKFGNNIPSQGVEFKSDLTGSTVSTTTENPDGTYSATLTGTKSGNAKITIVLNGKAFAVAPVIVKLTADSTNPDGGKSAMSAAPATIVANNSQESVLKLILRDANDNLISGQTVTFTTVLNGVTISGTAEDQDGIYTANLKGTVAGTAPVKVFVGGTELAVNAVSVELTADSSKPDSGKSVLEAAPATIVADNTKESVLTLTLRDVNGNLIPGQGILFKADLSGTVISGTREDTPGIYTATLKGTKSGDAHITVTLNGNAFNVAGTTVTLTADSTNPDNGKSELTATPDTIVADGADKSVLKLILRDANDNLITGQDVVFVTDPANVSVTPAAENTGGTYTAELKGTQAGVVAVKVKVNGTELPATSVNVTLIGDKTHPDISKSELTATPETIVADGKDGSALKLILRDVNGNLITGQTVLFSTALGNTAITDNAEAQGGTYTATLKGTTAGTATIKVSLNGTELAGITTDVKLIGDKNNPDSTKSELTALPGQIVADGKDGAVLKLILRDVNNNLLPGQTVEFITALGNTAITDNDEPQDGVYTATLKGTTAGTATIKVKVNGTELTGISADVILIGDKNNPDGTKSELTALPDTIVANGTAESKLKLILRDINGNLITGQEVIFTSTLENTTVGGTSENTGGTYTASLTGTTSGKATIGVTVNGTALTITAAEVTLTADKDNPDSGKSELTAAPETIVANNTDESVLKLTLRDVNGNLISGQTVELKTALENTVITMTPGDQDGVYTATLKGTKAGTATVTVTVNGTELAGLTKDVTLIGDKNNPDSSKSELVVTPETITADDTDTSALKLILRDVNNNLITGQTVEFSTALANTTITAKPEAPQGSYNAVLKGKTAGNAEIKVKVNGADFGVASKTVKLIADKSTAKMIITNLNTDKHAVADTVSVNNLEIKVVDANDNPISGVNIKVTEKTQPAMVMIDNAEGVTGADGVFKPGVRSKIQNVSLSVSAKDAGGIDITEDYALIFDLVKFTLKSAIVTN
ncbi:invasin domain 3-containing protein [Morganella morganii]